MSIDWTLLAVLVGGALFALLGAIQRESRFSLTALSGPDRTFKPWSTAAGILGFLVVWQSAAILSADSGVARIPTPTASIAALIELLASGSLLLDFLKSAIRIVVGFGLSLIVGVTLGILAGTFTLINRLLAPSLSFLRYVPPTAFIAVLILYFGVGEAHKYSVIFVAIVFFNFQMTVDAVRSIAKPYWEMGAVEQLSIRCLLGWVVIPGAAPRLWDMCRINLSFAWTFLTAAELVASDGGMGALLTRSQRLLRIDDLFAVILFFGIIGVLTDAMMAKAGRRMFPWYFRESTS